MQRPCGVIVRLTENIQACLRIFRRAQHQWLARDILHLPQGVFYVFVLWNTGPIRPNRLIRGRKESTGQVFILVYRLAIDAKTLQGDGVGG